MNERTINEQYKYIVELIEQKRLKEALTQLESFLWQCPDWELRNTWSSYKPLITLCCNT